MPPKFNCHLRNDFNYLLWRQLVKIIRRQTASYFSLEVWG